MGEFIGKRGLCASWGRWRLLWRLEGVLGNSDGLWLGRWFGRGRGWWSVQGYRGCLVIERRRHGRRRTASEQYQGQDSYYE